ncbi:hypothetical protein J4G33_00925 [Actinotalea sp. BY-33]|uniref:CBS domain-containing protein n=2 Tax=Actinotalea soli TaxID=2819234 RepID=A0A939LPW9_9CELL|nr:hypothetical protein [Actinotalea soli]
MRATNAHLAVIRADGDVLGVVTLADVLARVLPTDDGTLRRGTSRPTLP